MESCPPLRAHALLACWLGGASLSLSLSTPAASVCQPPPPPICLTLVCIDARWGEGENTSTKFYAVNRATAFWEDSIHSNAHTDPPLPVLYTHPPPSHLVYPRGFCSSIGQLFFPSTSLCVSCFVLVLFSRIPEFIEGFIGLSRASLSFLNHYSPLRLQHPRSATVEAGFFCPWEDYEHVLGKACVWEGEREREDVRRRSRRSIFVHVTVGKGWLCGSELPWLSQDVLSW